MFDWSVCRGRDLAQTIQHLENFIEYENYDSENTDQSKLRYIPSMTWLFISNSSSIICSRCRRFWHATFKIA